MSQANYILIVLILYKSLLLLIGFWAQRRIKNQEDFFLGGREMGPFVSALSYSASSSSAWQLLGFSGIVVLIGISAIWLLLGSFFGMLIAWFWVAPKLRKLTLDNDDLTLVDFICHKSTGAGRQVLVSICAVVILISFALYVAAQFQGAGNLFSTSFNMPVARGVVIGAVIIAIYTMLGGFWAVSLTDAVQGVIMAFAAMALPIAAVMHIGGPLELISALTSVASSAQLHLTGESLGLMAAGVIFGNLAVCLGPLGQPHMLVRFMAIRDDKAIRQGRKITIAWFLIVQLGIFIVGLSGIAMQADYQNPENIFFILTTELFHPVIGGLIIAAVLSAIMSTADSQLLVSASVLSHDLKLNERFKISALALSRIAVVFMVIAATLITLLMPEAIFSRAIFAWTALGAAFGPIIAIRLLGYDITTLIKIASVCTGFVLAIVFYLAADAPGDFAERVIPFCCAFLIAWFGKKSIKVSQA